MKDYPTPPLRVKSEISFIDVQWLKQKINQRKRSIIHITPSDITAVKDFISATGYLVLQAEGEAETTCVSLCLSGQADVVLSEDSDVQAYGNVEQVTNFNPYTGTGKRIVKSHLLHVLGELASCEITEEMFRDFCIMCGTDYNNRIPSIGPVGAWKLITAYKSIENFPDIDSTVLNFVRSRELFTPPIYKEKVRGYARPIEWNIVESWLAIHQCKIKL
jgi:5'-3' exonuclease